MTGVNPPGLFLGSTAYLQESIAGISKEDLINNWSSVCTMMDW
jgi:hypothetical protein